MTKITLSFPSVLDAIGYRIYRTARVFTGRPRRRRMGRLTKRNKAKRRRAALEGR